MGLYRGYIQIIGYVLGFYSDNEKGIENCNNGLCGQGLVALETGTLFALMH